MKYTSIAIALFFTSTLHAQKLTREEKRVVAIVDQRMPEAIAFLEKIVNINSGTNNLEGVKAVGTAFKKELDAIGFMAEWINMPTEMKRAGHLLAERKGIKGRNYYYWATLIRCLNRKAREMVLCARTPWFMVLGPVI